MDVGKEPSLCIAVIGATGELARGKIFPALFALYYSGFLPEVQYTRFSLFYFFYVWFGVDVNLIAFQSNFNVEIKKLLIVAFGQTHIC